MVPLYAARIEDLGPGDFVKVDCAGCEHTALLALAFLLRLGVRLHDRVLACGLRECDRDRARFWT
jgi:hypothetical protein